MKVRIVVEREFHREALVRLLPLGPSDCEVRVSGERSSSTILARNLLAMYQEPLALLFDTKTMDPSAIWEALTTKKEILKVVAPGVPRDVFPAIPFLEIIFLEDAFYPRLKRIFPRYDYSLPVMLVKTAPEQALNYILETGGGPKNLQRLLDTLDGEDVEVLRKMPPIAQLVEFVSTAISHHAGRQTG
jgi:hypothetical protein